jgi:radical SAM protein with 4Fe4S-binding SPASM domain
MALDFRIDSHKLLFHPERVAEWRRTGDCFPILAEISPSGVCNHRCVFCAFDYRGYNQKPLSLDVWLRALGEMAGLGLKSVVIAGEGEPPLFKGIESLVKEAKGFGLDLAMASNGVPLTPQLAEEILPFLTWIRFSVNAGSAETYSRIHRTRAEDFERALSNIAEAARHKRERRLSVTLGVQCVLLPENEGEVTALGRRVKEAGADYFTVKPYSQHHESLHSRSVDYSRAEEVRREVESLAEERFTVAFRLASMRMKGREKTYSRCRGLPFWTYITTNGGVYGCSAYLGDPDWRFGSIESQPFGEIWRGAARRRLMERLPGWDISNCRELCRLDKINAYLEELAVPGPHVNFI